MFVSGRIAVTANGITDEKDITPQTNVIFVRTKMDYGTKQRVIGAAAKVVNVKNKKGKKGTEPDMQLDVGAYQIALLVHNILEWRGPDFAGVACLPHNVERLDANEPIVQEVLQVIANANLDPAAGAPAEADEADDNDPNVIEQQLTTS